MEKFELTWQIGHMDSENGQPQEWMPAKVPGAAQQDYARYKQWPPFYEGVNFRDYKWMEDVFWLYKAPLDFHLQSGQRAYLHFLGIDYRYQIRVGGEILCEREGMFSPVHLDVTRFSDTGASVEVLIYPAPKANDPDLKVDTRDEGRECCKAVACYGWDWHPRLLTAGLWDEVYLTVENAFCVETLDASYALNETLDQVTVTARAKTSLDGRVRFTLVDPEGNAVASDQIEAKNGEGMGCLTLANPRLWYPVGYGEQCRYTLKAETLNEDGTAADEKIRRMGFRRSRMVMNQGAWAYPKDFPKSRSDAPATLEINGRRIFAKGSNWVNAQVFPGEMTEEHYEQMLDLVRDANMNMLRVWGGGFINKERFFDLCDEKGIMVWQEFPLACNLYPDKDPYLAVLEQEATAIVRRLRTHPSVVLWCGGNELFNGWSRMTEQSHPLRLLDTICYTEDRYTPFIMTSPLNGMGHGHYLNYDETTQREFITDLHNSRNTAYTEFGCPGMASAEYLRTFMSEEDFNDCRAENDVWKSHHGFGAWTPKCWVRIPEVEYFFGGYTGTEDLCRKTVFIQCMSYRSAFEEMRRQWPACSMALNWCLNEPWPTAANNSLISWPAQPKEAYESVKAALRPQTSSFDVIRHRWRGGEVFEGKVWMLNDSIEELPAGEVMVSYALDGDYTELGTFRFSTLAPQSNVRCGAVAFHLPEDYTGEIHIRLRVEGHPEMDADYVYLCMCKKWRPAHRMLNM